ILGYDEASFLSYVWSGSFLILPWFWYRIKWKRNAEEFMPSDRPWPADEEILKEWELDYIHNSRMAAREQARNDNDKSWQRAGNVPELAGFIHKPPPLPQTSQPKKKWRLWRAALYGALFMLVVRLVHAVASDNPDAFFPRNTGEFIGYL